MNIFSFTGDILHLASILILLLKIYTTKNVRGISLYTQILYLVVFLCRYSDLFWNFYSVYNEIMKVVFIVSSSAIVYLFIVDRRYSTTYDKSTEQPVLLAYICLPCLVLCVLLTSQYTIFELLWTFSILLESVAIVPQLLLVHNHAKSNNGFIENLTSNYVFTLGGYRAMYIINWIYRYITEPHFHNWLPVICGLIQTGIYGDFFYYYITASMNGMYIALCV